MKFRTISEAKAELGTLVTLAVGGETVVISRHGRPAVRLEPVEEGDFELTARDAGKLRRWLARERAASRTTEHASVDDLLKSARSRRRRSGS